MLAVALIAPSAPDVSGDRILSLLERVIPARVWIVLFGVALLAAIYQALRAGMAHWLLRRRLRSFAGRASQAETRAARLLTGAGYVVLGAQVRCTYTVWIDERPLSIGLRADYVVRRKQRLYVAEVKSGRLAPSLETAATRRQLLEYRTAFDVDGVLLVDAETSCIHEIVFEPSLGDRHRWSTSPS
jgi:hypothetical protein